MSRTPRIVSRIPVGVILIGLAACGTSGGGTIVAIPGDNPAASVVVSPSSATLGVGGTLQLNATLLDGNGEELSGEVSWTSSNSDVAPVSDSGLVTALAEGVATITASAGDQSGTALITVANPSAVFGQLSFSISGSLKLLSKQDSSGP